MNPLVHTMEAQFHGAANAAQLRALHAAADWSGLLEYALLLAEQEANQRSQIHWLVQEAAAAPPAGVEQWHLDLAEELLRGRRREI
jgi:hypothetical protein